MIGNDAPGRVVRVYLRDLDAMLIVVGERSFYGQSLTKDVRRAGAVGVTELVTRRLPLLERAVYKLSTGEVINGNKATMSGKEARLGVVSA